MEDLRIYLPPRTVERFRKISMERFGYGRGSLSKAAEVAITRWLEETQYIDENLLRISNLARKDKNILAVLLYGSFSRGEDSFEDIDVSILLNVDKVNSPKFLSEYEDEKGMFDLTILNRLPLNIQKDVFRDGKVVYCSNEEKLYKYAIGKARKWTEFKPRFQRIVKERNLV